MAHAVSRAILRLTIFGNLAEILGNVFFLSILKTYIDSIIAALRGIELAKAILPYASILASEADAESASPKLCYESSKLVLHKREQLAVEVVL